MGRQADFSAFQRFLSLIQGVLKTSRHVRRHCPARANGTRTVSPALVLEELDHPEEISVNTDTNLGRPQTAIGAAALVALCALAPAVARADQPTATQVAKVSLGGLDLSTVEGSRAAYARIKTAAERLCFQVESDPFQEIYARCVRETLADVIRRINAPILAAHAK
jgi:UrcA family protein